MRKLRLLADSELPHVRLTTEQAAVIADLTALALRTGFVINGCGCCGSPGLESYSADGLRELGSGSYLVSVSLSSAEELEWVGVEYTVKVIVEGIRYTMFADGRRGIVE